MRGSRAKDIRKEVLSYMKENKVDMKKFKGIYRRTKKDYTRGLA